MSRQEDTIARLRAERDRLRNEVVALRGHEKHNYEVVNTDELGKTQQYHCLFCGHWTPAPVHAYFHPCPGRQL